MTICLRRSRVKVLADVSLPFFLNMMLLYSVTQVARHVVQEKNDIKLAMEFLKECPSVKIEDILPFFPDFVTIDHFKVLFLIITIVDIFIIVNIIMNIVNTIISILKIEDILPFFPDFVTIDHFKASAVTTIVISSSSIIDTPAPPSSSMRTPSPSSRQRFVTPCSNTPTTSTS